MLYHVIHATLKYGVHRIQKQVQCLQHGVFVAATMLKGQLQTQLLPSLRVICRGSLEDVRMQALVADVTIPITQNIHCLLYTSPSPRDA